jgi:tetratricopeptide (TPR) repeat protein
MRHSMTKASALVLLVFSLTSGAWAQYQNQNQNQNQNNQNQKNKKDQGGTSLDQEKPGEQANGAAKDEAKAYKELYDARNGDPARLIEVGEGFLAKFPNSVYAGAVYAELASAYLNTNQPDKMVVAGTKAVEINPDNVDVLPLLAWAIPRRVTGQTPDAAQQLAKAQDYAKHGIQLLTTMPKPEEMDDAAFTKAKNEKLAMCHDGIGVAEVKTGKYDAAIAELNQSVELSATPDPVDFYLLGVANQLTSHFTDAIASFTKCSTAGPPQIQAQCKAGLDDAKKKAQNSLEAPK